MPTSPRVRAERVEVRRSRELILAAAELHFSTSDAELTMSQLAHMAGVGNATLYRRYPSMDDVVRELYGHLIGELDGLAAGVMAQPTGWDAIVAVVTGIVDTLQKHPAIGRLNRRMVAQEDDRRLTTQWDAQLDGLVRMAQAEGTLRGDVNSTDITFAAFRLGSYSNLPPHERDRILGRQIGIVLDGLRADGVRVELPGGLITSDDVHEIFRYEVANPGPTP